MALIARMACMALGIFLPIGPLAGYCVLTTAMKRLYIRRYGWQ